jgi:hypothetical protein
MLGQNITVAGTCGKKELFTSWQIGSRKMETGRS